MKKIVINGMGRIGRQTFRAIFDNKITPWSCTTHNKHNKFKLVAVNDLMDIKTLIHLLKYDSIYGKFEKEIIETKNGFLVDKEEIKVFQESDPNNLPWKKLEIDVVLECTGFFTDLEKAKKHINAGAKKVIISAPSKSEEIKTFILGINHVNFDSKKDDVISMGSCTTNCLAPIVKVLDNNFKIQQGFMTTVHSYTNDQRILDLEHRDLRRARAAAINIIPTTTGATAMIGRVLPNLKGKLDGISLRVPTPVVSTLDLICTVEKTPTYEKIIQTFEKEISQQEFDILRLEKQPLVSSDYIRDRYSAIIDQDLIMVKGNLIKITAWYDNEWAYSCRLVDFANII